ncbi:hypothetical protein [Streptomyces virginiae]|uniref:hypothetical protein n=1 Tax=Streptomyces virginiae TaxID=1961 RepID=UPI002253BC05|nr:hypothetical protein [Streptomyces virginiae]MCX4716969.1 hypothetical protein [Streptomyces virginiae]MCX5274725.1 hypothetical protein [Streptomyces virginiae]
MRTNEKMTRMLAEYPVSELTDRDIPPMFHEVAVEGWSYTPNGARVLTGLVPELAGSYVDVLQEETSINGRGMIDYDLPAAESDRTGPLLRRCLAYVFACLVEAERKFGDQEVRSYVILSLGGEDDDLLTATVTFCTHNPDALPYIRDVENVQDAAVAELALNDREGWY